MQHRVARRALALAATLVIALTGTVTADSVSADGDLVTPSIQTFVDLGSVPAGATRTVDIGLVLVCRNLVHPARGASIVMTPANPVAPTGGGISATAVTLGPVPADWPQEGEACIGDPVLEATEASTVTVVAPALGGLSGVVYTIDFVPSAAEGLSGTTRMFFRLTVLPNSAPVVTVPDDLRVEANTLGGWTGVWEAGASDAEDGPLSATCAPSPGDVLALGTTTVTCTATDTAGATGSGSFVVEVVDTVAPHLELPADLEIETADPVGAAVTWPDPVATDTVDGSVVVACLPASGSTFPVGTTTVTCEAADASGNSTDASFDVHVALVRQVAVAWGQPIGAAGTFEANAGRTVPLKALITIDGQPMEAGSAAPRLWLGRLDACGGSIVGVEDGGAFAWDGQAWHRNLDTTLLDGGCWAVAVSVDASVGGTFELSLGALEPIVAAGKRSPSIR